MENNPWNPNGTGMPAPLNMHIKDQFDERDAVFIQRYPLLCTVPNQSLFTAAMTGSNPEVTPRALSDEIMDLANAFMEQYLRQYIDYSQEDVYEWLPMAEFSANNSVNASTKITPFFANKGFHPRMSFGPPRSNERISSKNLRQQITAGNDFASKMAEVLDVLRTNLNYAKDKQEYPANRNRSQAPAYRVGDEVFLD